MLQGTKKEKVDLFGAYVVREGRELFQGKQAEVGFTSRLCSR